MHQYNYKNITKILPNYLVLVLDKILALNIQSNTGNFLVYTT